MLASFCFLYSAFNFSNQCDLIIAYNLAARTLLQSVYLHQARYGSDHIFVYLGSYASSACIILYSFGATFNFASVLQTLAAHIVIIYFFLVKY